jgi:hypothetical protein
LSLHRGSRAKKFGARPLRNIWNKGLDGGAQCRAALLFFANVGVG